MAKNNISEWSTTPGSNLDLGGISVAEGWLPNSVNNFEREEIAQLAKFYDDFGGVNTVAGTGDAITVTTSTVYTALATGMRFRFKAGAVNTGAVTLNLDGIGAKAVRKIIAGADVALAAGDITNARSYDVVYDATANAAAGAWIIQPSKVALPDGTVALPGLYFDADTDTGFYRIGANEIGAAANGALVLDIATTGLGVTGTLSITGTAAGTLATITSTDAGASAGPTIDLDRFSASPAASDSLGSVVFNGRNASAIKTAYAQITTTLNAATAGAETGTLRVTLMSAGSPTPYLTMGGTSPGITLNAPSAVVGALDLSNASSGQVVFPATQNASANANTLDDYEEGTWTALLVSSGGSITTQTLNSATRTKVGRNVTVTFDITITATGTSSGVLTITGVTDAAAFTSMGIARETGVTGNTYAVQITGSTLSLQRYDNGAQSFANSSRYVGSVTYPAAT